MNTKELVMNMIVELDKLVKEYETFEGPGKEILKQEFRVAARMYNNLITNIDSNIVRYFSLSIHAYVEEKKSGYYKI